MKERLRNGSKLEHANSQKDSYRNWKRSSTISSSGDLNEWEEKEAQQNNCEHRRRGTEKIFGETATLIIYGYLEDNLSLKREKIPEKMELFSQGIDKFFGSGAYVPEKTILTSLYSSFGFDFKEKKGYTFVDYVTQLKNQLSTN